MTTTEFIKLIKASKESRKKILSIDWVYVSESELKKIEQVNVKLLEALKLADKYDYCFEKQDMNFIKELIKNASNIHNI